MKFALFYEIPVPRPWEEDSELVAYQNTLEQAIAGDRFGWHAFWTVEHHFLQEYSHCSNPEVLYGAIASRTERIRLGYGVRLMPKPYNHPVRTAESVAVLDLISGGRVDLGHRPLGHPGRARGLRHRPGARAAACGRRRSSTSSAAGPTTSTSSPGEFWQMPRRRVQPKPWQKPHPPLWGATTSDEGHAQVGELGLGLCSFAVGLPPVGGEAQDRHLPGGRGAAAPSPSARSCTTRRRRSPWPSAARTATRPSPRPGSPSSGTPRPGARQIATLTDWMAERNEDLGTYSYAADMKKTDDEGTLDLLSLEYLIDANACVLGTPDECMEACRQYEAAGVDLLLCLVNPYKVSHESVMQTIELMGTEVIPALQPTDRARGARRHRAGLGDGERPGAGASGRWPRRLAVPGVAAATRRRLGDVVLAGPGVRARRAGEPRAGRTGRHVGRAGPGRPRAVLGLPGQDHRAAGRGQHADPAPGRDARRLLHRAQRGRPTACNYTAPYAGSCRHRPPTTLEAGPCGSVGLEIVGAAPAATCGPGPRSSTVPALGFAQLAPGATVSGTGTWDQTKPNSTEPGRRPGATRSSSTTRTSASPCAWSYPDRRAGGIERAGVAQPHQRPSGNERDLPHGAAAEQVVERPGHVVEGVLRPGARGRASRRPPWPAGRPSRARCCVGVPHGPDAPVDADHASGSAAGPG